MHFASGLLAVTSNLSSSTPTDGTAPILAWQLLVVAGLGVAGAVAWVATKLANRQLVPVKVRKQ